MRLLVWFVVAVIVQSCSMENEAYNQQILQYRAALNYRFLDERSSPLKPEQRNQFKGLLFFEPNINYRIQAEFIPSQNKQIIPMPHTLGRTYDYVEAGTLRFELNGTKLQLMSYVRAGFENKDTVELFVPFMDKTNGVTTYDAGRYLDIKASLQQQHIEVDFNMAYQPYCAFNDEFSCPIPPKQNRIPTAIEAGEKYNPNLH